MRCKVLILAVLLLSGCRLEPADTVANHGYVDAIVTYSDAPYNEMLVRPGNGPSKFGGGVTVEHFGDAVRVCVGRFRPSEVDSAYSVGFADGLDRKLSGALEEAAIHRAERDSLLRMGASVSDDYNTPDAWFPRMCVAGQDHYPVAVTERPDQSQYGVVSFGHGPYNQAFYVKPGEHLRIFPKDLRVYWNEPADGEGRSMSALVDSLRLEIDSLESQLRHARKGKG